MNCGDVQAKVHSYVDTELDKASRIDVDEHLQTCAACTQVYAEQQSLDSILKQRAPDFRESAQLRARIESSLPSSRKTTRSGSIPQPGWWSFAATICLAVALMWGLNVHQGVVDFEDGLKEDAVAVHMRSLLENHLVDIQSSDATQMQTWFNSRLPYTVSVTDLSSQGYTLVGGRLDYLYSQPLAAVVYRQGESFINVLIWPASKSEQFPSSILKDSSVYVTFLKKNDTNFCVISNMNLADFSKFTQALMHG